MHGAKAPGAYYTPKTLADVLASWIIESGDEFLLEPSAGDGALIRSAVAQAAARTGSAARLRFIACDVDPKATAGLQQWLSPHNVLTMDFLALSPDEVPPLDGVLTNPPLTRTHALPAAMRANLRKRFKIDGAAGLWAYVLLHSCDFLTEGGRLAAVVPASAVFTRYGRCVLVRTAVRNSATGAAG